VCVCVECTGPKRKNPSWTTIPRLEKGFDGCLGRSQEVRWRRGSFPRLTCVIRSDNFPHQTKRRPLGHGSTDVRCLADDHQHHLTKLVLHLIPKSQDEDELDIGIFPSLSLSHQTPPAQGSGCDCSLGGFEPKGTSGAWRAAGCALRRAHSHRNPLSSTPIVVQR